MIKTLEEIAEIKIIFVFRDKAPALSDNGNAYIFNIRDLISNWPFSANILPKAFVDERKLVDAVVPGDILLPGRGQSFPARHYSGEIGPILPAGQIYNIRVKDRNLVDPVYLAWYLNRADTQEAIKNSLTGTTIPALNKSALQKISIQIPSLPKQRFISKLEHLFQKRVKIREKLNTLEAEQLEKICENLLEKDFDDDA
jgi:restriction endonuclease S subunit